jgi:hypothetical protein
VAAFWPVAPHGRPDCRAPAGSDLTGQFFLDAPHKGNGDPGGGRGTNHCATNVWLSNASAGAENYKLTVKSGCDASIAGIGVTTWRLDRDELVLVGRGGSWRFSESDATSWERIPPSTDPLLLMRQ